MYFSYQVWTEHLEHGYMSFLNRLCCLIGLSTVVLFYISGLYNDTLVQPRKFIPQANRALRHFNVKLVATNRGWLRIFGRPGPSEGLRLIVSSKAGSMHFREAFEDYRDEFWQEIGRCSSNKTQKLCNDK